MRVVRALLLRPYVAAGVVALVIVLPILVVGEASDNEARARARSEMFETGAGVADRAVREIEQYFLVANGRLNTIAAGDLRRAVMTRDTEAMYRAANRAVALAGQGRRGLPTVTRVAIANERGDLFLELRRDDIASCFESARLGARCDASTFVAKAQGKADPIAAELVGPTSAQIFRLLEPFAADLLGRPTAGVAMGSVITANDASVAPIGLLLIEVALDDGAAGLRPRLDRSEDVYVIDRAGRYLVGSRDEPSATLADLSHSSLIAKAIRSQPIVPSTAPVTLREEGADPFTGQTRPFASAVMTNVTKGLSGTNVSISGLNPFSASPQDRYGWQVLVVPDQSALRDVEATLLQLRLARIGLGVLLVLGALVIASAARAVSRQRYALSRTLEQQTATSELLAVISRSTSDVTPVFQTIADAAVKLCRADHAGVYRRDGGDLVGTAISGTWAGIPVGGRLAIPGGGETTVVGRAVVERRSIHIPDVLKDPLLSSWKNIGLNRTRLAVPILKDGEPIGAIRVGRDAVRPFNDSEIALVESFATQAAIAMENARLFNETHEKSRQLEAASRHKSEFLANMSHELRTPLNAVIGFSDVLEQGMVGPLSEKQSEYVRDISTSGQHLLDLVNEILDLSKVEAGRMELEPSDFPLADTIQAATSFVRERAARHSIEIASELAPDLGTITADERKVRQVLLNLLSNAVKFTPDGGWVGVTARREDGEVTVSVKDTGIGIAPEDQPKVFEEFQQVGKPSDRSREGTGLGLTLAKRFVELHGGRIWLESDVGKGTTFSFALPVTAAAISAPAASPVAT